MVAVIEITLATPDIICIEVRDPPIVRGITQTLSVADTGAYIDGNPSPAVPFGGTNLWLARTNPNTGLTDACVVQGFDKKHLRFQDQRATTYFNRTAALVAANWLVDAAAPTNVYLRSEPYEFSSALQGSVNGVGGCNATSSVHYIYLKLGSNLSQATHTITFPSGCGISPQSFTFSDTVTRACAIRGTQVGHRPSDVNKLAYLALWVPSAPNDGQFDFSTYSLTGAGKAMLIDATGTQVGSSFAVTQRVAPTTIEVGSPSYLLNPQHPMYASTNNSWAITGITNSTACRVTAPGHGLNGGDRCYIDGMTTASGTLGINNSTGLGLNASHSSYVAFIASKFDANNVDMFQVGGHLDLMPTLSIASPAVVTMANTFAAGQTFVFSTTGALPTGVTAGTIYFVSATGLSGSSFQFSATNGGASINTSGTQSGLLTVGTPVDTSTLSTLNASDPAVIYKANLANRAGTYVYGIDYSAINAAALVGTTPPYRIRIPGLGVSDPFPINDSVWWTVAQNDGKGLYNHRSGMALDPAVGGYSRPSIMNGGIDITINKSYLPISWSQNSPNYPIKAADSGDFNGGTPIGGYVPWITGATITGSVGYNDASDQETRMYGACQTAYWLLDVFELLSTSGKNTHFGIPQSNAVLDPTVYPMTDLPDLVNSAIWGLDAWRKTQAGDGSVSTGMFMLSGTGQWLEPSWLHRGAGDGTNKSVFVWAADLENYYYVIGAAKLAIILNQIAATKTGATATQYTTLASLYQTSAINCWNWCESIRWNGGTEAAPNAFNTGHTADTFYATAKKNAEAMMLSANPTVVSGGSGFAVNDVIPLAAGTGGTLLAPAYLLVTGVSGGAITSVEVIGANIIGIAAPNPWCGYWQNGATPSNPVPQGTAFTGSGTGATFNCAFTSRNGWTLNTTYVSNMNSMVFGTRQVRLMAAGILFRLLGVGAGNAYATIVTTDGPYAAGADAQGDLGLFDFQLVPGLTGANATAAATIQNDIFSVCDNLILAYSQHSTLSYRHLAINNANGRFGTNGGTDTNVVISNLIHAFAIDKAANPGGSTRQTNILSALQAHMGFNHGANQRGISLTSGIGVRNITGGEYPDRELGGTPYPPGITIYGFSALYRLWVTNFGPGTASGIVENPEPNSILFPGFNYETNFENERTTYPPVMLFQFPIFESLPQQGRVLENMEYTLYPTISSKFAGSMFLSGWDGNAPGGVLVSFADDTGPIISALETTA